MCCPPGTARLHVEQGAAGPRHAEGAAPNVRGAEDKLPVQRLAELRVERLRPGPVGAVGACSQETGAWRGAPDSGLLAAGLGPLPGAGALRSPAGRPAAAPISPSWWPPPPPPVPGQGGSPGGGSRGLCSGFMGAPVYWLAFLHEEEPFLWFPFFPASFVFCLVLVLDLIKFLPGCVGFYSFKVLIANYSRDSVWSSACPKLGH